MQRSTGKSITHRTKPRLDRTLNVLLHMVLLVMIAGLSSCELVDMKIVDEPSSYGLNHVTSPIQDATLTLRVVPANVSGPPHLSRLMGRCYSQEFNNYKYDLCPFHNLTQHEQRNQWNPYNGVLGVWQQWEIENNTFVAMVMEDGDSCGQRFRSARVSFECGNHSKIVNVSEPETCKYHLVFRTPLVCHPESMLVYPTLREELRHRWDNLEVERSQGLWTAKGYKKRLSEIFEAAGLHMSREGHTQLKEEAIKELYKTGQFSTLDQCKQGYKELQDKVKSLEEQLKNLHQSPEHSEDFFL